MKKLLSLILALIMIAAAAVGCAGGTGTSDASSDVGTPSGSESDSGSGSTDVTPEQKYKDMLIADDAFVDSLWAPTEERINAILNSESTIVPAEGGTAWYVSEKSGKDSNDGLTPETALKSLVGVTRKQKQGKIDAGDVVYFERGSTYPTVDTFFPVSGVTYSAYGEGAKPILTTTLGNAADPSYWQQLEGNPNVWYTTKLVDHRHVGNIVFNDGEAQGELLDFEYVEEDPNGKVGDLLTGLPFDGPESLDADYKFLYSNYKNASSTYAVYLYCSAGNPGEVFDSIYFCRYMTVINAGNTEGVVIDNLSIRYGGAHGISANNSKNFTVQNCEIAYIGGSMRDDELYDGTHYRRWNTRLGNGVEVYGSCDGFYIKNNYAHDVRDEAFTTQCTDGSDPLMRDLHYTGNVTLRCGVAVSLFGGTGVEVLEFSDNHCWYSGYGNLAGSSHLFGEGGGAISISKQLSPEETFIMKNNVIAFGGAFLVRFQYGYETCQFDNNLYLADDTTYLSVNLHEIVTKWDDNAVAAMKTAIHDETAKMYVYLTEGYESKRTQDSMTIPADVKVGDTVKFGVYEQDNITENGAEEIEWIVMSVEDGKALLLSKYVLEVEKVCPHEPGDMTWGRTEITKFLDYEFAPRAFTEAESAKLNAVQLRFEGNNKYTDYILSEEKYPGKVFFLSAEELIQYLGEDGLKASATEYAINREGYGFNLPVKDGGASYYTRNYGNCYKAVGVITWEGVYDAYGSFWWTSCCKGIRPAVLVTIGE